MLREARGGEGEGGGGVNRNLWERQEMRHERRSKRLARPRNLPFPFSSPNPSHSVVKIADFGLARKKAVQNDGKMTHVGTPFWAAPEMITHAAYSEKADVYSFGIVLWELVAREDPYKVS